MIRAESKSVTSKLNKKLVKKGRVVLETVDNAGSPFLVVVCINDETKKLDVVIVCTDSYGTRKFGKSHVVCDADAVWVGCGVYDKKGPQFVGNTVLIVHGKRMTSVSSNVYTFDLLHNDDDVVKYVSRVGNSSVPYGWIETNHGIYATDGFNCLDDGDRVVFMQWDAIEPKLDKGCLGATPGIQRVPRVKAVDGM
jgi:hypothetical protein